ncbi:hypothetical protein [Trichlorobacter sp.]|uniref:hypothetical protein n=1 Tax=Trichlorobacter sp. TaxID=2911007 RepID=UPI002A362BC2|nr:hypothetical protein [Trichlorobacter sp.]MDY0384574.1 hypothetical protein [Trichlorobacter sp.]
MNIQNSKNRPLNKLLLVITALALALYSNISQAEDYSNNIGFMKNPPKELKEKFPMCEQFLDVKWIRQFPNGGWVGTVTADVYFGAKKEQRELAVMQQQGEFVTDSNAKVIDMLDMTNSTCRGRALVELISTADMAISRYRYHDNPQLAFAVKKGNESTLIFRQKRDDRNSTELVNGLPKRSFAQFSRNICVTLPTQKAGWLVETHKPFLIESRMSTLDKKQFQLFMKIAVRDCPIISPQLPSGIASSICSNFKEETARLFSAYDYDGDGKTDYYADFLHVTAFINDDRPFIMKGPSGCDNGRFFKTGQLHLEPYDSQKVSKCISNEKSKYLKKLENTNR